MVRPMNRRRTLGLLLLVSALLLLPRLLGASYPPKYLADIVPEVTALLSPPPTAGSPEAAADLATTRQASVGRLPEQVAAAQRENTLSPFRFAVVLGPWFQAENLPMLATLFGRLESDVYVATSAIKKLYQRPRPYAVDPTIQPLEPENTFSYPSGHSTRATAFAIVLAELFPARRTELIQFAQTIGWNRVIGGVHYHTDIVAGRVLGQAVVRELLKNKEFQQDLAAGKAEIAAVAPAQAMLRP